MHQWCPFYSVCGTCVKGLGACGGEYVGHKQLYLTAACGGGSGDLKHMNCLVALSGQIRLTSPVCVCVCVRLCVSSLSP